MAKEEQIFAIERLIRLEGLAQRKAEIYAKLLTDQTLANDFSAAAQRHARRKQLLISFLEGEQRAKGNKGNE